MVPTALCYPHAGLSVYLSAWCWLIRHLLLLCCATVCERLPRISRQICSPETLQLACFNVLCYQKCFLVLSSRLAFLVWTNFDVCCKKHGLAEACFHFPQLHVGTFTVACILTGVVCQFLCRNLVDSPRTRLAHDISSAPSGRHISEVCTAGPDTSPKSIV